VALDVEQPAKDKGTNAQGNVNLAQLVVDERCREDLGIVQPSEGGQRQHVALQAVGLVHGHVAVVRLGAEELLAGDVDHQQGLINRTGMGVNSGGEHSGAGSVPQTRGRTG